jgi:hypothetical protein
MTLGMSVMTLEDILIAYFANISNTNIKADRVISVV